MRADEILNKWPEAEVARILRDYGEERRWRQLARKIVEQRLAGGIQTTAHLVELIGGGNFGMKAPYLPNKPWNWLLNNRHQDFFPPSLHDIAHLLVYRSLSGV